MRNKTHLQRIGSDEDSIASIKNESPQKVEEHFRIFNNSLKKSIDKSALTIEQISTSVAGTIYNFSLRIHFILSRTMCGFSDSDYENMKTQATEMLHKLHNFVDGILQSDPLHILIQGTNEKNQGARMYQESLASIRSYLSCRTEETKDVWDVLLAAKYQFKATLRLISESSASNSTAASGLSGDGGEIDLNKSY